MDKNEERVADARLEELAVMPISPFVQSRFKMVPRTTRITSVEVHSMARELIAFRADAARRIEEGK